MASKLLLLAATAAFMLSGTVAQTASWVCYPVDVTVGTTGPAPANPLPNCTDRPCFAAGYCDELGTGALYKDRGIQAVCVLGGLIQPDASCTEEPKPPAAPPATAFTTPVESCGTFTAVPCYRTLCQESAAPAPTGRDDPDLQLCTAAAPWTCNNDCVDFVQVANRTRQVLCTEVTATMSSDNPPVFSDPVFSVQTNTALCNPATAGANFAAVPSVDDLIDLCIPALENPCKVCCTSTSTVVNVSNQVVKGDLNLIIIANAQDHQDQVIVESGEVDVIGGAIMPILGLKVSAGAIVRGGLL